MKNQNRVKANQIRVKHGKNDKNLKCITYLVLITVYYITLQTLHLRIRPNHVIYSLR